MQKISIGLLTLSVMVSLPLQASITLPLNVPLPVTVAPAIDSSSTPVPELITPSAVSLDSTTNEAVNPALGQHLEPSLRLMPKSPNMTQLQELLPNWSLMDEFGRSLLPIAEDLLTDVEKKALNLVRCRFLNAQHAALDYGLLEPRQAVATTGINVHVICPLGQSFSLVPVQDNQPVDAYHIAPKGTEHAGLKITLLDISGRPLQHMQYSGTGRVETLQLIGLLQPSDGETKLPAGEVRLPANSSVLIKLP